MERAFWMKVRQGLLIILMIAMLVNIAISGYIYYAKVFGTGSTCFVTPDGPGDCLKVQLSSYSSLLGIPLVFYGIVTFGILFVLLAMNFSEKTKTFMTTNARKYSNQVKIALIVGMMFIGAFSLWLLALQFFILKQTCFFCLWVDSISVVSAIIFLSSFSRGLFDE